MRAKSEELSDKWQYIKEWSEQCVIRYYEKVRRDGKWVVTRTDVYNKTVDVISRKIDVTGTVSREVMTQVKGSLLYDSLLLEYPKLDAYCQFAQTLRTPESFWLAYVSLKQRAGMLYNLEHMSARLNTVKEMTSQLGQNPARHSVAFSPMLASLKWTLSQDEILKGNLIDTGVLVERQPILPMDFGVSEDDSIE